MYSECHLLNLMNVSRHNLKKALNIIYPTGSKYHKCFILFSYINYRHPLSFCSKKKFSNRSTNKQTTLLWCEEGLEYFQNDFHSAHLPPKRNTLLKFYVFRFSGLGRALMSHSVSQEAIIYVH